MTWPFQGGTARSVVALRPPPGWFLALILGHFLLASAAMAQEGALQPPPAGQEAAVPIGQEPPPAAGADPDKFEVRAQPPEDFLDLVAPQTTVIDVYYGGTKVATALATFTPSYVQIHDTLALMPSFGDVTEPEEVLQALTGPLQPNSDLVCLPGDSEESCGLLEPQVAGVIFDRNSFRLDVFVNPAFRAVSLPEMGRHLEPTDTGPGLVSGLKGIVSGGTEQDRSYLLRNDTILGYMDNRVETSLLVDNQDGLFLDRGVGVMERGDWRVTTGLFRTAGMDAAGQEKIIGAGIATQLDTRVDLDLAYATPIILFLPNRSKVDIFRDGRLLATNIYDAGNQTIDTSGLPNGSYDITLRIQEIGGETREETRFFSKNPELPPADTPLWVLQLGALVDDSKVDGVRRVVGSVESVPILRAGTLHRLGENWGVFADTMASNKQLLLELGGLLRERPARLRGSLIATTDLDVGFALRYSDRSGPLGYNVNVRQIFAGDTSQATNPNEFDPYTASIRELGGGINYTLLEPAMTLGFQGSYNQRGSDSSWSFGPSVGANLWQTGAYDFRFNSSVTQSDDQLLAIAQITMSYRDDNWAALSTAGFRVETGGDTGPEGSANVSWLKSFEDGRQFQFSTGVFRSVNTTSLSGTAGYVDSLGAVALTFDRSMGDQTSTTYSGEIEIDLVGNLDGIEVTGFGGSDAAIIVDIDGDIPDDATFDLFIDGTRRASMTGTGSVPIVVEPYRTYEVSILSGSDSLFAYELEAQRVTAFPGTVATMTWNVLRILPVFGRAVHPDGSPVVLARIEGAHDIASTDTDGNFQAQINGTRELVFSAPGEPTCRVEVGELPHEAVFFDLGTVVCER